MTERLRQVAISDEDVQEFAISDEECFGDRADRFIADYQEQRGRHPGRPSRSASPRGSAGAGRSLDAQGLQTLLEKQFATAQQVLAAQHEQSLQVVRHYCSRQVHQQGAPAANLPGSVGGAPSPTAGESQSERCQTSPTVPKLQLPQQTASVQIKARVQANKPAMLLHSKPEDGIIQKDKVMEPVGTAPVLDSPRSGRSDRGLPTDHFRKSFGKTALSDGGKRVTAHDKAMTTSQKARMMMKQSKEDGPRPSQSGPKMVFADAADMKAKVKEAIMKPEYNVANFYKKTGIWQKVARSTPFDNFTLMVIGLNAIWIAIDTDHNNANTLLEADMFFQVGENLFCIYFSGEVFVRFMAFARKRDGLKDAWFVFDSALVLMMVIETWILNLVFWSLGSSAGEGGLGNASVLRLVRLLRLTRMARMVRLLRALPELMILVKGISVATRSVFFTLCLLVIFIYIFAIAFTQLAADTELEDEYFKSVPMSMSTLLLRGTLPDLADFVNTVGGENAAFAVLLMFFVLLSSLTVMNMLVGVLCEVVSVVSSVEKEQMTVQFVKTKLLAMLECSGIDQDGNKRISKSEFEALLLMPEGAKIIQEVGVDVVGLVDFADHIFKDDIELSFPDFMELVLQLRDNNVATVRDIVNVRKLMTNLCQDLSVIVDDVVRDSMANMFSDMMASLGKMSSAKPVQVQLEDVYNHESHENIHNVRPVNDYVRPVNDYVKPVNDSQVSTAYGRAANRSISPPPVQSRPQTGANSRPQTGQAKQVRIQGDRVRPTSGNVLARSPVVPPAFPANMWLAEYDDNSAMKY